MARRVFWGCYVALSAIVCASFAGCLYEWHGEKVERDLRERMPAFLEEAKKKGLSPKETIALLDQAVDRECSFTVSWADRPDTRFEDSNIAPSLVEKIDEATQLLFAVNVPGISLYDPGYLALIKFRDGRCVSYDDSFATDR